MLCSLLLSSYRLHECLCGCVLYMRLRSSRSRLGNRRLVYCQTHDDDPGTPVCLELSRHQPTRSLPLREAHLVTDPNGAEVEVQSLVAFAGEPLGVVPMVFWSMARLSLLVVSMRVRNESQDGTVQLTACQTSAQHLANLPPVRTQSVSSASWTPTPAWLCCRTRTSSG